MRIHRLSVLSFLLPALFSTSALAGPELDRARRNTAIARGVLDSAERKLREFEAQQDKARLEVDRLRDARAAAERRLDDLRDEQRFLPQRIRDAEDRAQRLRGDLDAPTRELERLAQPLAEAVAVERDAAGKVKAQQAIFVRLFEMSDEYRGAVAAAQEAVKLEAETDAAVESRVRNRPEYKAALAKYTAARDQLDALKGDANAETSQRAAAALAVIETEKVTQRMEIEADKTDPALAEARKLVKETEAALAALIAEFERDLPRRPAMAQALAAHRTAAAESDRLATLTRNAESRLRSIQQDIDSATGEANSLRRRLDDFDKIITVARGDIDVITANINIQNGVVANLAADIARQRREVDVAERRYDDARRFEIIAARRDEENERNKEKDKK